MSQIRVIRDHNLKLSPIVIPLSTPREDERPSNTVGMVTQISQTATYGVTTPIVKIGDIVVSHKDVVYFELDNTGHIPTLELVIRDPNNIIKGLQTPSSDNEIRIEILPKFENAYKKIDMVFYAGSCEYDGEEIIISGIYKVLDLYGTHTKCFGEITTYDMFDKLSAECKLGFASNVENTSDKRYLYCASENYTDFMDYAVKSSGDSVQGIQSTVLYDYWIDYWNNINFVDIYERFLSIDDDEDIMIWISQAVYTEQNNSQLSKDEELYARVPAIITNHPTAVGSDLGIEEYQLVNSSTAISKGTDRIISTYNMIDGEALDYLLTDGDQKKDIAAKYNYLGECYREFDYLLAAECRDMKKDKMNGETIEVTLHSPALAITKGSKVNLQWYDANNELQSAKERAGINDDIKTNINIPQADKGARYDSGPTYELNKQVSGQYYVLSNTIVYRDNEWENTLRLTRPRDNKQQYLVGLTEAIEKQL